MKTELNHKVDTYLLDGCMQCKLGATPACKINQWQNELRFLRNLLLECGLQEDFKWMHPCYTADGKNIVLMHVFNNYGALLFPKGVLIHDSHRLLTQQTEHSQTVRQLRFTNLQELLAQEAHIRAYVLEAIAIEKSGKKPHLKVTSDFDIPLELENKFDQMPAFKNAFYALTPGRQRGYLIHFSQPKQAATRSGRIEKAIERIFEGKGLNDL